MSEVKEIYGNRERRGKIAAWVREHLPDPAVILIISIFVGILCGVSATLLKWLVKEIGILLTGHLDPHHGNYGLLVFPLAGVLLTSMWQRYVIKRDCSQSTMHIKESLMTRNYKMKPGLMWDPVLTCAMTIGFGASAGTEGPVAYSGAAIGSNVGRWLRLPPHHLRLLIGVGAGAGISAIFKSPVGGALFTLEILKLEMGTLPVLALITACILSTATAEMLTHYTLDLPVGVAQMPEFDPATLGWVAIFGVIAGIYCLYYNYTSGVTGRFLKRIENPWGANIVSGVMLSLTLFLMPVFFGEGTPAMITIGSGNIPELLAYGPFAGHVQSVKVLLMALGGVLLLKGALVAAAYFGGGVAGDFMPTLFAGSFLGLFFVTALDMLFGISLPGWYFALMGMGAVMGGTLRAPLMGIFIACESTGTYRYLPAYIVAVVISFTIVKLLGPRKLD